MYPAGICGACGEELRAELGRRQLLQTDEGRWLLEWVGAEARLQISLLVSIAKGRQTQSDGFP